jgi:hypothetical protein
MNPSTVTCPTASNEISGNLVDSQGESIPVETLTFKANAGSLESDFSSTSNAGAATSVLTYDWSFGVETINLSSNTVITGDGVSHPIYNSIPITFVSDSSSGDIIAEEGFESAQGNIIQNWTEYGETNWSIKLWRWGFRF